MKLQCLRWTRFLAGAVASALVIGCGGGGGSADTAAAPGASSTTLIGTVATGKPLAGAAITIMDAAGRSRSAMTAADGSYAVDASDLMAPLVLRASGTRSGAAVNMVSMLDALVASSANVANITPLTTAIAANLSMTGQAWDLNPVTDRDRIAAMLVAADTALQAQIASMMQAMGVNGSPIHTPFLANGSGYDKLYDNIVVGRTTANKLIIGPAAFHDGQNVNNCPLGGSYAGCAPMYGDMGMATITNPNLCGFDIATGAGIACDPTRAVGEQPSAPLSPITGGGVPMTGPGITVGAPDSGSMSPGGPNLPASSPYAGHYTGSYGGDDSGSFSLAIGASGQLFGTGFSNGQGTSFVLSGQVGPTGSVTFGIAGGGVSASYQGAIDASGALTGTWSANPPAVASGSFSGHRQ